MPISDSDDRARHDEQHSLDPHYADLVVRITNRTIRFVVRMLAVLMPVLVLLGVADVTWVLYKKLLTPPLHLLSVNDILATFGGFLAVLIRRESRRRAWMEFAEPPPTRAAARLARRR